MAYNGAGIDPSQLQTQLALAMDLSRSTKGQEEEKEGMLRKMRFAGPPMLSGGSGQTIMGGYAGFMRPGNGVMGGVTINPPVTPEPPQPPVIGNPPTPPGGGSYGTPITPPQNTYWSPPSFPVFSFEQTEETFPSYVPPNTFNNNSQPSLWEIVNPPGGGVNPNTDNYGNLINPGGNWWTLFQQWFAHQQQQNTEETSTSSPWTQPADSPYCHSIFNPNPTIPQFRREDEGTPLEFKPERWDPTDGDPDPDTVYQCRSNQQTACALCAWTATDENPEIEVNITCPGGAGGNAPGGGGGNYFFDTPGGGPGEPYWDGPNLKVPIPDNCCSGPGGGQIRIDVKMTYEVECPSCTCCYYRLMDGQPSGQNGVVQQIPTKCKADVIMSPYFVNCCKDG